MNNNEEKMDYSILELFQAEIKNQSKFFEDELANFKEGVPPTTEQFATLQRIGHSIKGTGRIVGLEPIVKIGLAIERFFDYLKEGKIALSNEHLSIFKQLMEEFKCFEQIPVSKLSENINNSRFVDLTNKITSFYSPQDKPQEKPQIQSATPPIQSKPSTITAPKQDKNIKIKRKIKFDSSMIDLFMLELENHTATLNQCLLALEINPQEKKELESLMRAAHSIKGAARVVSLEPIVDLTHLMEDCFVQAQKDELVFDNEKIDVMLQAVDFLVNIYKVGANQLEFWLENELSRLDDLIEAIKAIKTNTPIPSLAPQERTSQEAEIKMIQAAIPDIELHDIAKPLPAPPSVQKASASTAASSTPQEKQEFIKPKTPADNQRPAQEKLKAVKEQEPQLKAPKEGDRILRVTAQNLNRLMGLAGESLVESRWLQPFAEELHKLKKNQYELTTIIDQLREDLENLSLDEQTKEYLQELQRETNECRSNLTDRLNDLEMFIRRHISHSNRLYSEVIDSRMRPFAEGVEAFPRLIQDLADELGKKIKFVIEGKSTSVDREILEKLEAPLNHLLRNSVDHGIEFPSERMALGKPEEGTIVLEARHVAGMLQISVSDNGRGVDLESLRKSIVVKNLASEELAANLSETELLEFLFLPGFSTAKKLTEISGRGVGLNVVQDILHEVGGSIRVVPEKGKGMTFYLKLPLTLSVIRSLLVEISGEPYAFPLARIDHTLLIEKNDLNLVENRQYFNHEGTNIGIVLAHQILELDEPKSMQNSLPVVVLTDRNNYYGIIVDKFIGERKLVVQELDPRIGKIPNISTGAFMEDGSSILIVDIDDLVKSIDIVLSGGILKRFNPAEDAQQVQQEATKEKRILVVDDSITVREVECRLLKNAGYHVDTAVDGLDGWNAVRTSNYDLIISDVDMPRMNGIELVKKIKNDMRLHVLPVIIVSYKEREEDRILGLESGANYYLTKSSFHGEVLINAVQELIGPAT